MQYSLRVWIKTLWGKRKEKKWLPTKPKNIVDEGYKGNGEINAAIRKTESILIQHQEIEMEAETISTTFNLPSKMKNGEKRKKTFQRK